ncbi:hypothetical protein O7634_02225 [Micromonospora sp. WMMD1120]|uniref:hypothetical protein n=1 Tax=Micromonospora sp. WMMD1120 TaxID=3016106 RepID=UPI002416FFD8|nr:hypothetical protein [Micromonospora sp. WMMD1120]MDG4805575.1 hypothetical protein [Micromonospora sp. WMMD1120]
MGLELERLGGLRVSRARLDEQELELIDRARYGGATWAEIATALGLGSRQAAEQRRQRLAAARWSRRQQLDSRVAPQLVALREAVAELGRWIDADRRWDSRFVRAALVRSTVRAALDAAPGSLYALALHLATDLADAGEPLPAPVRTAAAKLDKALSTNH